MVLADTSVWIDHLRSALSELRDLLREEKILIHPFVIGELACGNLRNRKELLALLHALPLVPRVEDDEMLFFIEKHSLAGKGLGLIDLHLLAASRMSNCALWTNDGRLKRAAQEMGLDYGRSADVRAGG